MKKKILLICAFIISLLSFSQNDKSIVMNDPIIQKYFDEFIIEALTRGLDIQEQLLTEIDYIIIVPEGDKSKELASFDSTIKLIKLSNNVRIDKLILKINLYRELFHILGVPYNKGSVIMNQKNSEWFSYAAFDDIDIMKIEIDLILGEII
tara:strand:+ start:321 stop:773 length:453 start_codon:yes stop_codon:yes gene_type:complete